MKIGEISLGGVGNADIGLLRIRLANERKDNLLVRWVYKRLASILSRLTLVSNRWGVGATPAKSEFDGGLRLLHLLIGVALAATLGLMIYLQWM
jgi:hypothetical protein